MKRYSLFSELVRKLFVCCDLGLWISWIQAIYMWVFPYFPCFFCLFWRLKDPTYCEHWAQPMYIWGPPFLAGLHFWSDNNSVQSPTCDNMVKLGVVVGIILSWSATQGISWHQVFCTLLDYSKSIGEHILAPFNGKLFSMSICFVPPTYTT